MAIRNGAHFDTDFGGDGRLTSGALLGVSYSSQQTETVINLWNNNPGAHMEPTGVGGSLANDLANSPLYATYSEHFAHGVRTASSIGYLYNAQFTGNPLIYIWKGIEYGVVNEREVLLYRNGPTQWHPLHVNRDNKDSVPTKPYNNLKPHWGQ